MRSQWCGGSLSMWRCWLPWFTTILLNWCRQYYAIYDPLLNINTKLRFVFDSNIFITSSHRHQNDFLSNTIACEITITDDSLKWTKFDFLFSRKIKLFLLFFSSSDFANAHSRNSLCSTAFTIVSNNTRHSTSLWRLLKMFTNINSSQFGENSREVHTCLHLTD